MKIFRQQSIKISIIIFIVITTGCKFLPSHKEDAGIEANNNNENRIESIKSINNDRSKLELVSILINDTLTGKWRDNIYGSPVVEKQELKFFWDGNVVKYYSVPIQKILKTATLTHEIYVASIPIVKICLLKGQAEDLYYVTGSDFCFGVECPEFTGIYTMNGVAIYEGISTLGPLSNKFISLTATLKKYEIKINKPEKCIDIMDLWRSKN